MRDSPDTETLALDELFASQKRRFLFFIGSASCIGSSVLSVHRFCQAQYLPALATGVMAFVCLLTILASWRGRVVFSSHLILIGASVSAALSQLTLNRGRGGPLVVVVFVIVAISLYLLPGKWSYVYSVLAALRALGVQVLQDADILPVSASAPGRFEWYVAFGTTFVIFMYVLILRDHNAKRAMQALKTALAAKTEFMRTMNHELRTPLNAVIGMTALLEESNLDSEQRECVATISNSGSHLLGLINNVLDFAKIESARIEFSLGTTDLRQVCSDVIRMFTRADGIQVRLTSVDADLPRYVLTDELRIRQVLINLIGNAVKFSHKGGAVDVSVRSTEPATPGSIGIAIEVKDHGIGIGTRPLSRIFEPFYQVEEEGFSRRAGTGLGLCDFEIHRGRSRGTHRSGKHTRKREHVYSLSPISHPLG